MKKIIFFILLINSINSQNLSELTEQNLFRGGNVFLIDKMNQLNDEFPASSWYLKNWIQDRNIKRTATM